jgi:WD40 repeat protein
VYLRRPRRATPGGGAGGSSPPGAIKIWDAQTGRETLTLKELSGYVRSVSFSPDGNRIVNGSDHKTLKVWDLETVPTAPAATRDPRCIESKQRKW